MAHHSAGAFEQVGRIAQSLLQIDLAHVDLFTAAPAAAATG
jgi:hypothetical protein